jgi:hypothetical protein
MFSVGWTNEPGSQRSLSRRERLPVRSDEVYNCDMSHKAEPLSDGVCGLRAIPRQDPSRRGENFGGHEGRH